MVKKWQDKALRNSVKRVTRMIKTRYLLSNNNDELFLKTSNRTTVMNYVQWVKITCDGEKAFEKYLFLPML